MLVYMQQSALHLLSGDCSFNTIPSDKSESYSTKKGLVKIYVKFIVRFSCGRCLLRQETYAYYTTVSERRCRIHFKVTHLQSCVKTKNNLRTPHLE